MRNGEIKTRVREAPDPLNYIVIFRQVIFEDLNVTDNINKYVL